MPRVVDRVSFAVIGALAIALVAVLGGVVDAGPLDPPGPPSSTMKTLDQVEARTPISSLPFLINQPGSYYLAKDLTGSGTGDGINVTTSNVTIDLNGFTLHGVAGSRHGIGILQVYKNVSVTNGTISGWGATGLNALPVTGMLVTDLRVSDNGSIGMEVGADSVIRNCVADHNGAGGIFTGANTIIDHCVARDNVGNGVTIGTSSLISDSVFFSNDGNGLAGGQNSTADNCTSEDNGLAGFVMSTGATVRNSKSQGNAGDGITLGSLGLAVRNHSFANGTASGAGVHATSSGNRIEENTVIANDAGIDIDTAGNLIIKNDARANTIEYDIVAGNEVGPIDGAASFDATNPWANIDR